MNDQQKLECDKIWKRMNDNNRSEQFRDPVDVEGLGLVDYNDIVKNPMDLSSIKQKLDSKSYKDAEEFKEDFCLMYDNCVAYNGRKSPIGKTAIDLKKVFLTNFKKVPIFNPKIEEEKTYSKFENFDEIVKKLENISSSNHYTTNWPFLQPVSTKEIPTYLNVIKKPMDLSTIKAKLTALKYPSKEEVVKDLNLIVQNCKEFNPKGTAVYKCGENMKRLINKYFVNCEMKSDEISEHIVVLKNKISDITKEIKSLEDELTEKRREEGISVGKKTYTLNERLKVGTLISTLSEEDALRYCQLVYDLDPTFDFHNKEVVEMDFKLLKDSVIEMTEKFLKTLLNKGE